MSKMSVALKARHRVTNSYFARFQRSKSWREAVTQGVVLGYHIRAFGACSVRSRWLLSMCSDEYDD